MGIEAGDGAVDGVVWAFIGVSRFYSSRPFLCVLTQWYGTMTAIQLNVLFIWHAAKPMAAIASTIALVCV